MDGTRIIKPAAVLIILLCSLITVASAVPPLPAEYYGSVTIDGSPAPAGTTITALVNDNARGTITLANAGTYGGTGIFDEKLVIAATETDVKDGNAMVTFKIGDKIAEQSFLFVAGDIKQLDLSSGGVPPTPVLSASFTGAPLSGSSPLNVQFTDTSSGNPVTWYWDFGDGEISSEQNPVHTFVNNGLYSITLTVSDASGASDTVKMENLVSVGDDGIVADFIGVPTSGDAPLTVQFTDLSTGDPTMWNWDFGDGNTEGMLADPTHTYEKPGSYTVTLTASNKDSTDVETKVAYINIPGTGGIDADFIAEPTSGDAPLTVKFTDLSTGDPTMWNWDFGDGVVPMSNDTAQCAGGNCNNVANPVHTYTSEGSYTVTLTASNKDSTDVETKVAYINILGTGGIDADFTVDKNSGQKPLTVQFTDLSTGSPTMWNWNFGDGTEEGMIASPTHTYETPGIYSVTLTASSMNDSDTITKDNFISVTGDIPPPVAMFEATPVSGNAPLDVQFKDLSIGPPTSYAWDFGDGITSTEADPLHTYSVEGTYTVTLKVTNSGGSHIMTRENYICVGTGGNKIVADFSGTPTTGVKPLTVKFQDLSTGTPTMWSWNFGDGKTEGMLANPTHTYDNPGTYTVTLTTSSQTGETSTKVRENYITVTGDGPVPPGVSGKIKIIYAPDRSSVYLNNELKGETAFLKNFMLSDLQPGVYQLRISKPGFSDYATNVQVMSGKTIEIMADMRITPTENGIISVYTYPEGSEVSVDGAVVGKGPVWMPEVTPGDHVVKVTAPGYLEWVQTITVGGKGSVSYVTAALYPSWWTPLYGYLMITSVPGNGAAYLDGTLQGNTPLTLSQISPGEHTVRVELNGYNVWEQKVTIMEGRTSYVIAQLSKGQSTPVTQMST